MINVEMTLDQYGEGANITPLVRIIIWNTGTGTPTRGNYKYSISHQYTSRFGKRAAKATGHKAPTKEDLLDWDGPWVWKFGTVSQFPKHKGAAALLATVMWRSEIAV